MKISYSTPAKVILSGEHAVVYGKPALVSSIDLRLTFSVINFARSPSQTWLSTKGDNTLKAISSIKQNIKNYLIKNKIKFQDKEFNFEIQSKIPIRRGLGSSAALCVAATGALLEFYTGRQFDKETINNIAYQAEKYFHINASGVDVSVSTFGGLIYYRKEFEFLKTISALNFKITKKIEDNLYLIDSGKPEELDQEMINIVGRLYNKKPQFIGEILDDIEKTTKRLVVSIVKEDVKFFQQSLVDNEILLEMLGVVSNKTRLLLKKLEPYGIGKIIGNGGRKNGSGYLLFYTEKQRVFEEYCKDKKISFFKFRQDLRGLVRI